MFGYHTFHGWEIDTVNAILSKNYCVVLMPTGGEKTVCYTVLRFIPPGFTIAVTPLIALIVDQCNACIGLDLMCYLLSSMEDKGKMVV